MQKLILAGLIAIILCGCSKEHASEILVPKPVQLNTSPNENNPSAVEVYAGMLYCDYYQPLYPYNGGFQYFSAWSEVTLDSVSSNEILVTHPKLYFGNYPVSQNFYYQNGNSDSILYDYAYQPGYLIKYFNPPRIVMDIIKQDGVLGSIHWTFSGNKE